MLWEEEQVEGVAMPMPFLCRHADLPDPSSLLPPIGWGRQRKEVGG